MASADDWREQVSTLCRGNPMMTVSVPLGLAGPLLEVLGLQGTGLHVFSATTNGKTTLQRLACSIWRDPNDIPTWNATRAGPEDHAAAHSGTLLARTRWEKPRLRRSASPLFGRTV